MITLRFEAGQNYGASTNHRTLIPIRLLPPTGAPFVVDALLDTGAGVSKFDHALLSRLGIADVTTGVKTDATAANGQTNTAYIHDVRLEFFGNHMTVPIAFCPDWQEGLTNLLGMRGFFERMLAAFDHRNRKLFYLL